VQLIGLELFNFRRFEKASLHLLDHPIAIVGPNEAGKSSILEALKRLNDASEIQQRDITRLTTPKPEDPIITAWFAIDKSDREVLSDIPESKAATKYLVTKTRNGSLVASVDPEFGRDPAPRVHALASLARVASGTWINGRKDDFRESLDEARTILSSGAPNLSSDQIESLRVLLGELPKEPSRSVPAVLRTKLATAIAYEARPHPRSEALSRLGQRQPEFLLFDLRERELEGVYDVTAVASSPPIALANFANLAGLDLRAAAAAVQASDYGVIEDIERAANERLGDAFSTAWQASALGVQIRFDHNELRILIKNRSSKFTELGERSDGLRMFVALMAYLGPEPREIRPVLLIDEAETHLHYDAQADLVRVLSEQDAASKVIYSTHSAGCLPLDLGNGIRPVLMRDGDRSVIEDSFWMLGTGFAPMVMAMGASTLAFTPTRRAVIGEGPSEAILVPSLMREVADPTTVDYQVAPGLANATDQAVANLDLEAARVAYLVDGDKSGSGIAKRLTGMGIPADRIVRLWPAASGASLEDVLDAHIYQEAINAELAVWAAGVSVPLSAIKTPYVPTMTKWCRDNKVKPPEKARVAAQVLAIARSDRKRALTSPSGRQALRRAHKAILEILERPDHMAPPAQ
jgi:predicted ATP-dependent endonuclease of OLD family